MAKVIVNADVTKGKIYKEIFGQFSEHLGRCIYGGIYVGEDSDIPNVHGMRTDVVEALKKLKVPVLRWPGGCFADEYHWKDGIGPKENRKRMVNTNWGGVVEDNSFGTHEFLEFCEMIGADPYINANVGSGTVQEMMEWVEYLTFDGESPMTKMRAENGHPEPWNIKWFGIGNENWGCGGSMTPEYYANEYRRYSTFCKDYYREADKDLPKDEQRKLYRIACGPNIDDYKWTDGVMKVVGHRANGLSLHYYTVPGDHWESKGSATDFDVREWFITMRKAYRLKELVENHGAIMDKYDPKKKIGLMVDEYGTWFDVEPGTNPGFLYQQNTLRDALVAGISLCVLMNENDRVRMGCIAQMVNVLQSMILTEGDKMVLTPTYHVFEMFNVHQDATRVALDIDCADYEMKGIKFQLSHEGRPQRPDDRKAQMKMPQIVSTASVDAEGALHISLCNVSHCDDADITIDVRGFDASSVTGRILTDEDMAAYNDFDTPDRLVPTEYTGLTLENGKITGKLPAKAVAVLEVK
ncbi:MAG: alpha-N-arabinofuranosidase [Lachnospiraceae bacterium]|nr:alpha-N-arabinofuranosidase [Lachnospiraceae bacterium]